MFKPKSDPSAGAAKAEPADAVQQARTRARHRLIGAIVLLAIGVIGFPLVFETQPRPVPLDIPIEIPKRDAMPPLAMPQAPLASAPVEAPPAATAARTATATPSEPIPETREDAGRDVTPAAPVAPVAPPASPPARTAARAEPAAAPKPAADGERARALLEGRPVAAAGASAPRAPASTEEPARYVLQVGAFADADAARESRKQVEKLGLKTYTQVAQTPGGSRIRVRVGPFTSRPEAEAALAKVKSAGHAAVVLTL